MDPILCVHLNSWETFSTNLSYCEFILVFINRFSIQYKLYEYKMRLSNVEELWVVGCVIHALLRRFRMDVLLENKLDVFKKMIMYRRIVRVLLTPENLALQRTLAFAHDYFNVEFNLTCGRKVVLAKTKPLLNTLSVFVYKINNIRFLVSTNAIVVSAVIFFFFMIVNILKQKTRIPPKKKRYDKP